MNYSGYQHYKQQSVSTMTKSEMLQLLYQEMLKRLTRAEMAIDENNEEIFEQSVTRATEIVQYLMDTLDMKYSVSQELMRMYQFFLYQLSRIQASKKKELIVELKPLVKELQETFLEAGKRSGY